LVVSFIVVAMTLWVFSGEWSNSIVEADEFSPGESLSVNDTALVRAVQSEAETRTLFLDVRGQTAANRMVQVKSEVAGKIIDLPSEKGLFVNKGDLLCRVAEDSRRAEYTQALAELESAKLEHDGFVDLNKKGLQSGIVLAKAKAALEESRTQTENARLALMKTEIIAPFNGVVTGQQAEVGDYLSPGSVCVSLMEVDPMLVAGRVAEKNIGQIRLEDEVAVQLITGERHIGRVSFVGHAPDDKTRTYPVEVTINNPGALIRTGLTAEMQVPVGAENVHLISPASLVLDDVGSVGVRIVDGDSRVRFMPVIIADENPAGIWVKGLPASVDLITVGQEEVSEGQLVSIDYSLLNSLVTTP
jgi:membrane fusion protein, multidrug efflux system